MKGLSQPGVLRLAWQALLLLGLGWGSWLMLQLSLPYLSMERNVDFLITKQNVYHIKPWRFSFYFHVFTSIFVLLAGFTQFSRYILRRYPKLHRWLGMSYVLIVVFISGPAGFVMGIYANGGLPARTSFVLLAFLWVLFTVLAYGYARKKKFEVHRAWMMRSYALTLSAITLRVYAYLFDVLNIHARPAEVYITIAWLSWVLNLLVAEWLVQRKKG
jgi:Predicted membrane protein (DUF2306)